MQHLRKSEASHSDLFATFYGWLISSRLASKAIRRRSLLEQAIQTQLKPKQLSAMAKYAETICSVFCMTGLLLMLLDTLQHSRHMHCEAIHTHIAGHQTLGQNTSKMD